MKKFLVLLLLLALWSCSSAPKPTTEDNIEVDNKGNSFSSEEDTIKSLRANRRTNIVRRGERPGSPPARQTFTPSPVVTVPTAASPTIELPSKGKEKLPLKAEVILTPDQILDKNTIFKTNELINYYGIPILILRVPTQKQENSQEQLAIEEQSSLDSYFQRTIIKTSKRNIKEIVLIAKHKELLEQMLARTKNNNKYILVMYVNGSSLNNWSSSSNKMEKMVYSSYISSYIFQRSTNIRLEKRYMEDIPDDELFFILLKYEGEIPMTVYNAPKGSTLRWLDQYRELELQRSEDDKLRKKEIDRLIVGASEGAITPLQPPSNESKAPPPTPPTTPTTPTTPLTRPTSSPSATPSPTSNPSATPTSPTSNPPASNPLANILTPKATTSTSQ